MSDDTEIDRYADPFIIIVSGKETKKIPGIVFIAYGKRFDVARESR